MRTLNDVWLEAQADDEAIVCDSRGWEAMINFGVKIMHHPKTGEVKIYNMLKGADYYRECSPEEYDTFLQKGWLLACVEMALENNKDKIAKIEDDLRHSTLNKKTRKSIELKFSNRRHRKNRYNELLQIKKNLI